MRAPLPCSAHLAIERDGAELYLDVAGLYHGRQNVEVITITLDGAPWPGELTRTEQAEAGEALEIALDDASRTEDDATPLSFRGRGGRNCNEDRDPPEVERWLAGGAP